MAADKAPATAPRPSGGHAGAVLAAHRTEDGLECDWCGVLWPCAVERLRPVVEAAVAWREALRRIDVQQALAAADRLRRAVDALERGRP